MIKKWINAFVALQMAGSAFLGYLAAVNFKPSSTWFLVLCVISFLAGLGLLFRSRIAYIIEIILLLPICELLLFQTGRRVWGIYSPNIS